METWPKNVDPLVQHMSLMCFKMEPHLSLLSLEGSAHVNKYELVMELFISLIMGQTFYLYESSVCPFQLKFTNKRWRLVINVWLLAFLVR